MQVGGDYAKFRIGRDNIRSSPGLRMTARTTLFLLAVALTASVQAAGAVSRYGYRAASHVRLASLPDYVTHVFVPVVPGVENTLTIDTLPIQWVIEQADGFDVRVRDGRAVVRTHAEDRHGYAKVRASGRDLTLSLVDLVPYDRLENGRLGGYHVGHYEEKPLRGLESYERPRGFIRLTGSNGDLRVSDRYRLRDFQCKLDGTTRYLVVRPEALIKLEILQHELARQHSLAFDRFTVMSGYRTPFYNRRIGNRTTYSRHVYGDAMDIYIDEDGDGSMDDIDGDGRVDTRDAQLILRVAEQIDASAEWGWLKGGAGVYRANSAHGPYIHVDTRGFVARWGATGEAASEAGGAMSLAR